MMVNCRPKRETIVGVSGIHISSYFVTEELFVGKYHWWFLVIIYIYTLKFLCNIFHLLQMINNPNSKHLDIYNSVLNVLWGKSIGLCCVGVFHPQPIIWSLQGNNTRIKCWYFNNHQHSEWRQYEQFLGTPASLSSLRRYFRKRKMRSYEIFQRFVFIL